MAENALSKLIDPLNRGMVAGTLGAPVDMAATGVNALRALAGYLGHKTGLLRADQMPELIEEPVMGSEWLGRQMQDVGLVSGERNALAEFAAGLMAPGALAAKIAKIPAATTTYASRSVKIRDPQQLPQRPFEHDYQSPPGGAARGERLGVDIEGRPLDPGATVFGRRVGGGGDEGIGAGEANRLVRELGIDRRFVSSGEIGGDAGRFSTKRGSILDPRIEIAESIGGKALDPATIDRLLQHELGHAIDKFASGGANINSAGVVRDLEHVYDFLNNRMGQQVAPRAAKKQHTPKADGYEGEQMRNEQWAEAIRLYMQSPNAIKTIAPRLAARIREVVNAHPTLSKVVQFNALPAAIGIGSQGGDEGSD